MSKTYYLSNILSKIAKALGAFLPSAP